MLISVSIKNLAVVEQIDLELHGGMSALTGETGAGKSILIDALGLALGNKADRGMIRANCEKAEINAVFDVSDNPEALGWLAQHELQEQDDCHLRRIITVDNRSRAFINGTPVNLKTLQSLGSLLIEIHGQHAHQRLLHNSFQLHSLDHYAGHEPQLQATAECFEKWQQAKHEYEHLLQLEQDRASRQELLQFQHDELQALDLQPDENQELGKRLKTLSNAERLIQHSYAIAAQLYDDDNALHSNLSGLQQRLAELAQLEPSLQAHVDMLESALINVQECSSELKHFADGIDTDSQSLAEVESRLADIQEMSRKYRLSPEQLPEKREAVALELEQLQASDKRLQELQQTLATLQQAYIGEAEKLHHSRITAADRLTKATVAILQRLAMPDVSFEIAVGQLPLDKASRQGFNRVEFRVSANPGQPPGPLKKIASGGELSRISLAIQVASMNQMDLPTLIFDEVDVGIGGATAETVGQLLRQLGQHQQVLCVTHLPQVAAQAHHHLRVTKAVAADSTSTQIHSLDDQQRIEEIARMLGGLNITRQTLAHAEEILASI